MNIDCTGKFYYKHSFIFIWPYLIVWSLLYSVVGPTHAGMWGSYNSDLYVLFHSWWLVISTMVLVVLIWCYNGIKVSSFQSNQCQPFFGILGCWPRWLDPFCIEVFAEYMCVDPSSIYCYFSWFKLEKMNTRVSGNGRPWINFTCFVPKPFFTIFWRYRWFLDDCHEEKGLQSKSRNSNNLYFWYGYFLLVRRQHCNDLWPIYNAGTVMYT